ncbi:MAG TPA: hypothetical protein VGB17_15625 [Pyrinomonadaceae bacterium]|jgi:hypothetical protein
MSNRAIEFIIGDYGPAEHPKLTVEVFSAYIKPFYEALKKALPYYCWHYEPDRQTWFILPAYTEQAAQVALEHFSAVWIVQGEKRTNFRTGEVIEQASLFG